MLRALVLLAALGVTCRVSAQATLIDDLGGPIGFGEGMLPPDDEEFSEEVSVLPGFPDGLTYFGTNYGSFWVNTNGNITFGMLVRTWTPRAFPVASQPMIAAWWSDVDTLAGPTEGGGNTIYYAVEPGRAVVTWYRVGYWDQHTDRASSFQIVITPGSGAAGAFALELRYALCEWSTADSSGGTMGVPNVRAETCAVDADCPIITASGSAREDRYACHENQCIGVPAQAGFDAGDLMRWLALPGSRTPAVVDLCTSSNLDPPEPGVFRFSDLSPEPACGNLFREPGEECDDQNLDDEDGCSSSCQIERCGDGTLQRGLGETCDDGNLVSGDDCSSTCIVEPPPVLTVTGTGCSVAHGETNGTLLSSTLALALFARSKRRRAKRAAAPPRARAK